MMLLNFFQSTPFKTLFFILLTFIFACSPADDDFNNGGGDPPPEENEWTVEACLSALETSTIVGNSLSFSSCNDNISEFRWSLNGDVVSTESTFNTAFSNPGTFSLELLVGDGKGNSSTTTENITVLEATDLFVALDIPHPAIRQSVGFRAATTDDLFLFTENQDENKIVLTNFNANLELKWSTALNPLNWSADHCSFAKTNNGWLINTTETVGDDSYISKWIILDASGNVLSESLTNSFYHKVIPLNNNELLAVGNKLVVLDNGQVGVQAVLEQFDGDLNLMKTAKLHTQAANSFASDVYFENGTFHVLSFVEQASGKWKAHYQNLTDLGPVTSSTPLEIEINDQAAINNINPEILVAGNQTFIRTDRQLFLPMANGTVQKLGYTEVEKIQGWNDQLLIITDSAVLLADAGGNQIWSRHLLAGTSTGAALVNNQMLFDRNVSMEYGEGSTAQSVFQIYLAGINEAGVFNEY